MPNLVDQSAQNIRVYNNTLSQRGLDAYELSGFHEQIKTDGCGSIHFFRICGIAKFWDEETDQGAVEMMSSIISGISANNMILLIILTGEKNGITFRIGVSDYAVDAVKNSIRAIYKGVEIKDCGIDDLQAYCNCFGGIVVGCPSLEETSAKSKKEKNEDRLAMLSRTMLGSEFCYMVIARGLSPVQTNMTHDRVLDVIQDANSRVRKTLTGGHLGNESIQMIDFAAQEYLTNLRMVERVIDAGCSTGLWRTCTYYSVKERSDYQKISNAIKMTFGGNKSKPQRIRCIQLPSVGSLIASQQMITNYDPQYQYHPLGAWNDAKTRRDVNMYVYQFENILDSSHLAAMTAIMHEELPGYYMDDYVSFDTSVRKMPEKKTG